MTHSAASTHVHQAHILVVDDEEMAREGLGKLLRRDGYIVSTAPDGRQALDLVERHAIDLVITDLRMPELDGMGLIRALRAKGYQGRIVVMTAYVNIQSYLEAIDSGAVEYINKPVRSDDIRAVIQHLLG